MGNIKTPAVQSLLITEPAFCAWLGRAEPGDMIVYHRGFLARDTSSCSERLSDFDRKELGRVASRALWAANKGLVDLVQRRHGSEDASYLAIARRRITSIPILIESEKP